MTRREQFKDDNPNRLVRAYFDKGRDHKSFKMAVTMKHEEIQKHLGRKK